MSESESEESEELSVEDPFTITEWSGESEAELLVSGEGLLATLEPDTFCSPLPRSSTKGRSLYFFSTAVGLPLKIVVATLGTNLINSRKSGLVSVTDATAVLYFSISRFGQETA